MQCPLCQGNTIPFSNTNNRVYHQCNICHAVMMKDDFHLPITQEEERYLLHSDDIDDSGYQKFVAPIVDTVCNEQSKKKIGLDFGSGNSAIITALLNEKGYQVHSYDPIFDPNPSALLQSYDFITCCEAMEHFYHPYKEFKLLKKMLKPKGVLYCKTNLLATASAFENWWYKNDPTHVFFYTKDTLHWIADHFQFEVEIHDKLIVFRN